MTKPIVGVIHVGALPGTPASKECWKRYVLSVWANVRGFAEHHNRRVKKFSFAEESSWP